MTKIRLYTTAPPSYDGFSTRELLPDAGTDNRGQTVRLVELDEADREWQANRYASGLHGVATPDEAKKYPAIWGVTAYKPHDLDAAELETLRHFCEPRRSRFSVPQDHQAAVSRLRFLGLIEAVFEGDERVWRTTDGGRVALARVVTPEAAR